MTKGYQLMNPASTQVSLLDMRMDSKRFPRIGAVSREQAVFEMSKIVSQAFLYKGQAADPKNIQFIACALVDELQADMDNLGTKNISFAEIQRVVKRSILKDEVYGISVASLFKIIIEYIKGEGHELQRQVQELRSKKEQRQIKESIIAPMIQCYSDAMLKKCKV